MWRAISAYPYIINADFGNKLRNRTLSNVATGQFELNDLNFLTNVDYHFKFILVVLFKHNNISQNNIKYLTENFTDMAL